MARAVRHLVALFLLCVPAFAAAALDRDFDRLEQALRLKPAQKAQYDVAVAATQRALLSVALSAMQLKDRLGDELGKARPDLGALARAQEDAIEQSRPLFAEAREEWLRLYALLDDDQVAVAKRFAQERLDGLLRPR